jgi:hypothetical protein
LREKKPNPKPNEGQVHPTARSKLPYHPTRPYDSTVSWPRKCASYTILGTT